jgi:hypothetical protein
MIPGPLLHHALLMIPGPLWHHVLLMIPSTTSRYFDCRNFERFHEIGLFSVNLPLTPSQQHQGLPRSGASPSPWWQ